MRCSLPEFAPVATPSIFDLLLGLTSVVGGRGQATRYFESGSGRRQYAGEPSKRADRRNVLYIWTSDGHQHVHPEAAGRRGGVWRRRRPQRAEVLERRDQSRADDARADLQSGAAEREAHACENAACPGRIPHDLRRTAVSCARAFRRRLRCRSRGAPTVCSDATIASQRSISKTRPADSTRREPTAR